MLLTGLMVSLLAAAPCTLTGRVELTQNGDKVETGEVVVYVVKVPARTRPQAEPHSIVQTNMQFVPRMLVVVKGETVRFKNEDNDEHSVFSEGALMPGFEFLPTRQGITGEKTFRVAGASRVGCKVHDWMRTDILVVENRFFTVVQPGSTWKIEGLPGGGEYSVVVWEPNGRQTQPTVVKSCAGDRAVALPPLEQGKVVRTGTYRPRGDAEPG